MDAADAIAHDDWYTLLDAHPIFDFPPRSRSGRGKALAEQSLEISTITSSQDSHSEHDFVLSGRRQLMALKDADLIVAAGSELRMTSLWDTKLGRGTGKSYKVLHVPNVDFQIHQLALNPSGKLLAVAGAYQVAVVVLPRAGYTKVVSSSIDCKAVQVGQFNHGTTSSVPIAKVDWHPWGEAGSTLMVMTLTTNSREYDISVDWEEPQQVLSFIPEKKSRSFLAQDPAEREGTSTPYVPTCLAMLRSRLHSSTPLNALSPAKQEFVSQDTSAAASNLSTLYDYQHKYVSALIKQLPPGTVFPAVSRSVLMHPPNTIKSQPSRQGPFLLQPSPRVLEGSEGGDATDIAYMAFADDGEEDYEGETERLGIIIVTYQDGKADVYLDVEKVEARWESKQASFRLERGNELPMFAVYETIDLGLISMLKTPPSSTSSLSDLLQGNHPVILPDPIHDDTVYIYHAFGVHSLEFGDLLHSLATALRADDDDGTTLCSTLETSVGTQVSPILSTFSFQRRCSNPVIALCVPNDVYLSYSVLPRPSHQLSSVTAPPTSTELTVPASFTPSDLLTQMDGPPAYVSLLDTEPFVPPAILTRRTSHARLSSGIPARELVLTPDTLRFFGTQVTSMTTHIRTVLLAHRSVKDRVELQKAEFARMQQKCGEMLRLVGLLKERVKDIQGAKEEGIVGRAERMKGKHKELMGRADRILQALMNGASPELSECETKWFGELGRMKAEVIGAGKFDEGSLKARTALLKREYERIMPSLKDVVAKEEQRRKRDSNNSQSLGISQAFGLGERSNIEKTKIAELEKEIVKMASQMQLSLGRPPSEGVGERDENVWLTQNELRLERPIFISPVASTPSLFGAKPPALDFIKSVVVAFTLPHTHDLTATLGASPSPAKDADKPKDVTPVTTAISVPPPSVLKGKTIEEIVNKWTADLDSHVREFNKFAGEVAVWDRALMENGNNLAAIYCHVLAVEREQSDIEQALDHIEQQQKDLVSTLDAYERSVGEVLGGQGGSLRALDTGPADTERDKNFVLATELHSHLDDLSGSLTQMIDSVNALSLAPSPNGSSQGSEDPMVQISQILSSHLESLQWIDGAVREVEGNVNEVEKRVRDVGVNDHTLSSSTAHKQRGFGPSR
ncbi:hypothetical protein J3R83DRAFT_1028 [Lanmaoa asiatica]|nr:hypothetical protein J3R83DRAFT_1028 [Lanmaoa asiatica]